MPFQTLPTRENQSRLAQLSWTDERHEVIKVEVAHVISFPTTEATRRYRDGFIRWTDCRSASI